MDEVQPNDSGSPNSFDKQRVKAQIQSLLLELVAQRSIEYIADFEWARFCDSYVRDHEARVEFGVDSSMCGGEWLVGRVRLQRSILWCIIRGRWSKMAFVLLRRGADSG
jgi:hypothetical protein